MSEDEPRTPKNKEVPHIKADKIFTVYVDGGKREDMTYGSFKIYTNQERNLITHITSIYGDGTSVTAEYITIINAVKYCVENGLLNARFYMDSLLVINQTHGNVKTIKPHLKKLRKVLLRYLEQMEWWELRKIPRKRIKAHLHH